MRQAHIVRAERPEDWSNFIAGVWARLARTYVGKAWLRRLELLRRDWTLYWSNRRPTPIGARAITRAEAFDNFLSRRRRVNQIL